MTPFLFYTFGAAVLLLCLLVVFSRNPVYSAGFLVATLFLQAGIFALLGATFLAAIQILIYAGAIMVLFLFVVMLIPLGKEALERPRLRPVPLLGAVILLGEIVWAIEEIGTIAIAKGGLPGSVQAIGRAIFRDFAVPLEVLSLLLLAAIVGAVTLARGRTA